MGQTLTHEPPDVKRRKITMAAIIAVVIKVVDVTVRHFSGR